MESIKENRYLKLNPGQLQSVRKNYNLEVDVIIQSIEILENWAKKQNHFLVKEFDRNFLERIIIICKGSLEKVKMKIDKQCTLRTLLPQYFVSQIPKEDERLFEKIKVVPLPQPNKNCERIFVVKVGEISVKPYEYIFFCRSHVLAVEFLWQYDFSNGNIVIYDLRNLNLLEIMSNISISDLRHMQTIFLDAFGARVPHILILTHYKAIDVIFTFCKQFLSAKMASRIHISSSPESLHSFVDKEFLPAEYGGHLGSLDSYHKEFLKELNSEEFVSHMQKMSQFRTDESLRLRDSFNDMNIGTAGTFRTITVD